MNEIVKSNNQEEFSALQTVDTNVSLAVMLARAEVDQQIATARALPRSPSRVAAKILSMATMDDKSAEECIYALPRGGKPIKGASIRLAEIIASQYGNCRVAARIVHVDRYEKFVEAEGLFHDLETNTATTARVRRRISGKDGRVYNDDMIIVTGNAACSIAKRNAILAGVPHPVWRTAYDTVERVLAGDIKTLVERRDLAMKAFAAFGVAPERIFEAIEVTGLEDISLDHLSTLTAMRSALKAGEATVEEMFPVKPAAGSAPKGTNAKLDALAQGPTPAHDPETGEIKDNELASRAPTGEARPEAGAQAVSNAAPAKAADAKTPASAATQQPAQRQVEPEATKPAAAAESPPAATARAATIAQEPKVGDDPERDAALLADLLPEADRRAAEGPDALAEFEENLSDLETDLVAAHIGALRKKARKSVAGKT